MNKLLDVHEVGCLQQASCNSLNPTSTIEPVSTHQIRQRLVTPFGNKVIGAVALERVIYVCDVWMSDEKKLEQLFARV
jgi:hypothetical protein